MPEPARRCAVCGKSLRGKIDRARYCSDTCRVKAGRLRHAGRLAEAHASVPESELSHRGRLERMRDQLTALLNVAGPREYSALSRELRQTLAEIDALPDESVVTLRDDILAQRAARRSAARASARSASAE